MKKYLKIYGRKCHDFTLAIYKYVIPYNYNNYNYNYMNVENVVI